MDKAEWNENAGHPMQSFEWGEFREKMGNKVSRIGLFQIIWSKLPLGLWFGYCPMSEMPSEADLKKFKGGVGVRFEPNVIKDSRFKVQDSMVPGRHLFKPKTYWMNLSLSEEDLLKNMTPKCRYNIRLAQKHGIVVKEGNVEDYLRLIRKTINRQKIYAHGEKYHRELSKIPWTKLFEARYKDVVVASWMIFVWKDFIYYAYGAFDDEYKNLMAPVLGLWEIAKWGKKNGYKTFDLWGAEEGKGYTRFKEQFGPKLVEMAGTYDLPVSRWYPVFRIAEEVRWKILRMLKT
ncbi:MAG: protein FemA [Microgenomates group bacterium Gr01-1014_16]|nr:MAG: protein FemA [Microgenomates group bacterium Gr01-1014_16]